MAFLVGIDNYGLYPLNLAPMETLRWALDHGARGVQFSGLDPEQEKNTDAGYLRECARFARENRLYIEWGGAQHIPMNMSDWSRKDLFSLNQKRAEQAEILGAGTVRSCSGGLMRWSAESPPTETLLRSMVPALKAQRTMLRDYGVILAIETHFEFTSFELLRLLDMCDAEPGDYLGICLDTLNLLTMLEDPLSAAKRLLPWVVSTHIKDGVLALDSDGMRSYPVTPGHGIVDLEGILHLLNQLERPVFLSLEDHAGSIAIPVFDPLFISKFPDLSASELARIVSLALRGNSLEKAKKTGPLSRDAWPEHCEERIRLGIQALRSLTGPLENQGVSHDSA